MNYLENLLEKSIFASRWLLAPVYIVLSISLFFITVKVIQELIYFAPIVLSTELIDLTNCIQIKFF